MPGGQVAITNDESLADAIELAGCFTQGERRVNLTAVCASSVFSPTKLSSSARRTGSGEKRSENTEVLSSVSSFLGAIIAASSVAVGSVLLVASAARR